MIKVKSKVNFDTQPINESGFKNAMDVRDSGLEKLDKVLIDDKGDPTGIGKGIKSISDLTGAMDDNIKSIDSKIKPLISDRRSIIARAKNSVLQFPVYIVDNVNISAAHIVAKAFERVYATFVQTVLSQYPIIDEDSINDLAFLKQFHTNLKESVDTVFNEFYQPIDEFDLMMQDSLHNVIINEDGVICRFEKTEPNNAHLLAENARLLNEPLSGFEHYLFEASDISKIKKQDGEESTTIKKYNPETNEREGINKKDVEDLFDKKAPGDPPKKGNYPDMPNKSDSPNDYDKKIKNWEKRCSAIDERYEIDLEQYEKSVEKYEDDRANFVQDVRDGKKTVYIKGQPVKYDSAKDVFYIPILGRKDVRSVTKSSSSEFRAPVLLRESEIKKINGMLPYTIDASFTIKSKDNNIINTIHYIIGIKSVLHLIKPNDLSEELQGLITGDIKNLQKVRYKTGEITFWKDYIFRKDELKRSASKNLDSSKRWVNNLKHLADYNKRQGTIFDQPISKLVDGEAPIPNATLILTQPVVQQMKNDTGIDLEDVGMAKKLARNLFLIAVCILDSSAGNMKVLFTDSDTTWDVQSIASIEAEVSKTDNSNLIKELNKVINK